MLSEKSYCSGKIRIKNTAQMFELMMFIQYKYDKAFEEILQALDQLYTNFKEILAVEFCVGLSQGLNSLKGIVDIKKQIIHFSVYLFENCQDC